MTIDLLAVIVAVSAVIATVTNLAQLFVAWITLKEIGDLDKDKKDWFEKRPWRKYPKQNR